MQISLERTGGFAGISQRINVDTTTLPPQKLEELSQLLAATDLFQLPERIISAHPQCDRFQYEVTVDDNGKQRTVIVPETALPRNLKTLIEWLNQVSQ